VNNAEYSGMTMRLFNNPGKIEDEKKRKGDSKQEQKNRSSFLTGKDEFKYGLEWLIVLY
jgi:hypothetical protein